MLLRERIASALVSALACCALTTASAIQAQTPPTQTRPRTTTTTAPPSTRPQTDAPASNVVPPAPTTESSSPSQTSDASEVSPEEADLAITANVTARELRFEVVPNPTVNFTGRPERKTVWEAERQNLPPAVRPGETYRDIGIRLRILSVFADIDRIVAEALGEIPLSDDTQPTARATTTIPPTTSEKSSPQQKGSTSSPAQANPSTPTANSQTGRGVQP